MMQAYVSVGSNIAPEENVIRALKLLAERVRITGISMVYLTEPLGPRAQAPFYNCVIAVETELAPMDLKRLVLREIENRLGRVRTSDKFAARTIDLDLILYDDFVMAGDELTLPDPEILRRPFLAAPLAELAPGLVIPGSGEPVAAVASRMQQSGMKPLASYTERLKKEMTA